MLTDLERKAPKYVDHVFDIPLELRAFTDSGDNRVIEGIATTAAVDRMGDVVVPEGAQFQLPLPLLWQHDPAHPVGNVVAAVVTPEGIRFKAVFAPEGVMSAIDSHWQEIKAGLVRYVSIGFRALQAKDAKEGGGRIFEKWEWLELSAVTIPANSDAAITTVKAFPIPERAKPIAQPVGASAAAAPIKARPMLSERIAAKTAQLNAARDQLANAANADSIDETKQVEIDELRSQVEAFGSQLASLQATEKTLAANVAAGGAPRQPSASPVSGEFIAGNYPTLKQRTAKPADLYFKAITAGFLAHLSHKSPDEVRASLYPGHQALEAFTKAVSQPADTQTTGWAKELVSITSAEFLESLAPLSVYGQLAAMGSKFTFGRAGVIRVPSRATAARLNGDFIGEGAPIPVKQGQITAVSLTPHKMAVISTFTRELAMHSTPDIEAMIRDAILYDTAVTLDTKLLDNVAGTLVRPAGLLYGVTGVPSSGTTPANIATDIKAALSPIIAANGGRRLVWIMNPAHLIGLSFAQSAAGAWLFRDEINQGKLFGFDIIASTNVPAGAVLVVDAADFASASEDSPNFDVSDVATLHMESDNTLVAPIVGGAAGAPVAAYPTRSLWQTASIGIRMLQDVTWAMRRPGMVNQITGVAW